MYYHLVPKKICNSPLPTNDKIRQILLTHWQKKSIKPTSTAIFHVLLISMIKYFQENYLAWQNSIVVESTENSEN